MKKEKRLSIILTVIQQNQFNKKQQIVDKYVYWKLNIEGRKLKLNITKLCLLPSNISSKVVESNLEKL